MSGPGVDGGRGVARPAWAADLLSEEGWAVLAGLVVAAFERRGFRVERGLEATLQVSRGTTSATFSFQTLARSVARQPPSRWPDDVETTVRVAESMEEGRLDRVPEHPERIRLRIVPGSRLADDRFALDTLGELAIVVALDTPDAVLTLEPGPAASDLGLEPGGLIDLALANMRRDLRPTLLEVSRPGNEIAVFEISLPPDEAQEWSASAALLIGALVAPDPGALVALPAAEIALVVPLVAGLPADAVPFLARGADRVHADARRPLTRDLFYWDGEFERIPLIAGRLPDGSEAIGVAVGERFSARHPGLAGGLAPGTGTRPS